MIEKIQQKSVKALFLKDNKILLVKDLKGVWEMPGGRINPGETIEETLHRELQEELGWNKVKINNVVDTWSFTSNASSVEREILVTVYFCETDEEIIKENEEYTEYRWVPINEIDHLKMRDGYKNSIKRFTD